MKVIVIALSWDAEIELDSRPNVGDFIWLTMADKKMSPFIVREVHYGLNGQLNVIVSPTTSIWGVRIVGKGNMGNISNNGPTDQ
jgi:hypothetical protein